MIKKIKIPYFSHRAKFLSPVLFLAAIYFLLTGVYVMAIVMGLMGAVLLKSNYVSIIDVKKNKIEDYLEVLLFRFNFQVISFDEVDKIIITKERKGYTANTRSRVRRVDYTQFTAHLLYEPNGSFELHTNMNKQDLLRVARDFAAFLHVKMEDHTTPYPQVINLR